MSGLFPVVSQSGNLEFECVDDRVNAIMTDDPLQSMVNRIRCLLEYDYILFNIHLESTHRAAIMDFISAMNNHDDAGLMEDAMLEAAQCMDRLQVVFKRRLDDIIPDSMSLDEFRRLSAPLVKIFDNMLGQSLKPGDAIDDLSFKRSVRTPMRNCIIVAVTGSPFDDIPADPYHRILEPYCKDYGCLVRECLSDMPFRESVHIKHPSDVIPEIVMIAQSLGIKRTKDGIHEFLSMLVDTDRIDILDFSISDNRFS